MKHRGKRRQRRPHPSVRRESKHHVSHVIKEAMTTLSLGGNRVDDENKSKPYSSRPANWWRKPEYRIYRQIARRYADEEPRDRSSSKRARYATLKLILVGKVVYDPRTKRLYHRDFCPPGLDACYQLDGLPWPYPRT